MNTVISGISSPPRFGLHELGYLLAGRDDERATRSRELLGIPALTKDDELFGAGISSLVARGLIERDQETVLPRNEAGLVGYALGTARLWVSLLARTGSKVDLVVFVQGTGASFMVRQAPANTLDFVPVKPGVTASEVTIDAINNLFDNTVDLSMIVRAASVTEDSGVFVQRRSDTGWQLGHDPVFPGNAEWPAPDLEVTPSTRDGVTGAISELLERYRVA